MVGPGPAEAYPNEAGPEYQSQAVEVQAMRGDGSSAGMHMIDRILGGCLANNKHYYDLKRCNMLIHVMTIDC